MWLLLRAVVYVSAARAVDLQPGEGGGESGERHGIQDSGSVAQAPLVGRKTEKSGVASRPAIFSTREHYHTTGISALRTSDI